MVDRPQPFRVADRRRETHDTWTLRLEPVVATGAPRFAPGQFAMLYAFGRGEAPISASAVDDAGVVHTVRAVGAVTEAICAAQPGEVLSVRGPFGTVWPVTEAAGRDVVLVAGGIGLAPLRPVVHELLAHRERYGRVSILYGGRSPAELLYADELAAWGAVPDVELMVTVDRPDDGWRGRVGVVPGLIAGATFDPAATLAMICGPEVMMRFAAAALGDRGVPDDAIWVSLERSMKCGVGHCGHCQLGPYFICKDGPVFRRDAVERLMRVPEL